MTRYRDKKLQVTENSRELGNLSPKIHQCFKIEGILLKTGYTGAYKKTDRPL